MKKTFKALKFSSIFMLTVLAFIACDKDFNTLGSDIIGDKNFETNSAIFSAVSYNKKLKPLQTNGLPSNLLGVFNDPEYGETVANIVTQVTPTSFNPDFGDNAVIDSVIMTIPYFSRIDTEQPISEAGETFYKISDSLYGDASIKLFIYRNNYFLRDFDPDSESNDSQKYYSNSNATINFDNHVGELLYEDPSFIPSNKEIQLFTLNEETMVKEVSERLAPGLRVSFDKPEDILFWTQTILAKEGQAELSNSNNFKDYFRGIYFNVQTDSNEGNMILLNLGASNSNITIYYSKDSTVAEETIQDTYVLNFTGNRLNTFTNNFNVTLTDGDAVAGDEKLYIKGSEGSMAIIDLFGGEDNDGNGFPDELDEFRSHKEDWLINEAQLTFYEDDALISPDEDYHKYDRVYLYDLKNNIPLADYFFDPSENTNFPVNSRIFHLGQRTVDEGGVAKYKIRITEHLNNILLRDSTNTKLGLVLSSNVNLPQNTGIFDSENDAVSEYPVGSVLSPRGTILYGSHDNVAENRRVKLEIFYTEPTN